MALFPAHTHGKQSRKQPRTSCPAIKKLHTRRPRSFQQSSREEYSVITMSGCETAQKCCTKLSWPCFQPITCKNSNLSRWKLKQSIQDGVRTFVHPSPCWKLQKTATLRDRMSAIGLLVMLQASCLLLEPRRLEDQLPSRAPAASPHSHSLLALQELINEEL